MNKTDSSKLVFNSTPCMDTGQVNICKHPEPALKVRVIQPAFQHTGYRDGIMVKSIMRFDRFLRGGWKILQLIGSDKTTGKIRKLATPCAPGIMLDVNWIKHALTYLFIKPACLRML